MAKLDPRRGELWLVNLDPTVGREIQKSRPAVVVSVDMLNASDLRIIVPMTEYKEQHRVYPWCVPIEPSIGNGLNKLSTADANQVKSASVDRFIRKLGVLPGEALRDVTAAIALCIDL